MAKPDLQRLLELCDVLGECELLPPGAFYIWARGNALREIRAIVPSENWWPGNGNPGAKTRE